VPEPLTSSQKDSDKQLMLSYRDGDSSAFNELYRRHRVALYRFIKNSCNTEAAAAELFQDVWSIAQLQVPLQPDELAELSNQSDALQSALSSLPAEQRDAVLLKHVAGFTLEEIATQFEENAETIKSRLRYATAKLRKQLRVLS